jgi:hypothetical protein
MYFYYVNVFLLLCMQYFVYSVSLCCSVCMCVVLSVCICVVLSVCICVVLSVCICVVLYVCICVVLSMCICVMNYCHWVSTHMQLKNISYQSLSRVLASPEWKCHINIICDTWNSFVCWLS